MIKKAVTVDFYENAAWQKKRLICGIDEVGRGCLAGPVVVAAAILPLNTTYQLTDSKKMTARARDKAYEWIVANCQYAVAMADPAFIEQHNIYQATLHCMRSVCLQLAARHPHTYAQLDHITVDAMPLTLPEVIDKPIAAFYKGETYSRSIAAASIVAKVTRDRLIARMAPLFPAYNFASDKAYASPKHCAQLRAGAATFIHRPQYIATVRTPKEKPVKPITKKNHEHQAALF